ncbi:MAG: phosphoenolpyruvate carboxylase [Gemmatimonadaceae bacterium]
MTAPPSRPQDQPLHEDIRWLAGTLGRVIQRLEGDDALSTVEELRQACRARRQGSSDAPTLDELVARVAELPIELSALAARAFTLFFLLINTAEQVHRVRRRNTYLRRDDDNPQPASARWTMRRLREMGRSATEVAQALTKLDVRPVLTAHPTESTRRTLLGLQARVADLLLRREFSSAAERRAIEDSLEGEVELLWLTPEVRQDRPTVLDEVSTVLWYLETRLLDASARTHDTVVRAYEEEFGRADETLRLTVPIRFGSWVGGDRDGNPFVTPETTLAAARRASHVILGRYRRGIDDLVEKLSIGSNITPPTRELLESLESDQAALPAVWETNHRRNSDEPLRLKLSFVAARLDATRRLVASRDAGREAPEPAAYEDVAAFERDLLLVRDYLIIAGASEACRTSFDPLFALVRANGFHGYALDVRDHADSHVAALADIASHIGLPDFDGEAMRRELRGSRPLVGARLPLAEGTVRVLDTMRAMATIQDESGAAAAQTYIISMARTPEDLLRVLLLARETGLVDLAAEPPVSRIDVVPLFETLADLEHAPAVMRTLFNDAVYSRQLAARGRRQEVMIGYSDSGKDAGMIASSWALYLGQQLLEDVFRDAGIELKLFHGRGGSVGRGGGSPVYRALAALPPNVGGGSLKITEQGEIISQQFGLAPIAERTLEVTLSGTLLHEFTDWRTGIEPGEVQRFRATMDALSAKSLELYRELVHDNEKLFDLFLEATPVGELAGARFGSRPAYRPGAKKGIEGIRAIPWQFGWTQIRLMLPGWLGVGTALADVGASADGLALLRRMAAIWPFFDDMLAKVEMVCAKTDLEIARAYVKRLGGDEQLFARLEAEFALTVEWLLRIRETPEMIADIPVLRAAIAVRNPYVDVLSVLQIALLERKRKSKDDEDTAARVTEALATTLNGVAQGLRNTG